MPESAASVPKAYEGQHVEKDEKQHEEESHPMIRSSDDKPRPPIESLTSTAKFEGLCALVTLANALFVGVQADFMMREPGEPTSGVLAAVGAGFTLYFILELALRASLERRRFLLGPNAAWNLFDISLVLLAILETVVELARQDGFQEAPRLSFLIRLLRATRLVRLLRPVRTMRIFRELRLVLRATWSSLKTVFWVACLAAGIAYFFSIVFMTAAAGRLVEMEGAPAENAEVAALSRHYGSVGASMRSLFMAVSGGIEWGEVADPLHDIWGGYYFLFAIYIVLVLYVLLNVLTAVVLDIMQDASQSDRDEVMREDVADLESHVAAVSAALAQQSASGQSTAATTASWSELEKCMATPDMSMWAAELDLDLSEAQGLFMLLDVDSNGKIDIEEFVLNCMRLKGQAKHVDLATLLYEQQRLLDKVRG